MMRLRIDPLFYFISLSSLWCGTALWLSSSLGLFDALFLGISVVTSTGLAPVDYSGLPSASQVVLFVAMICGSNILLSALPSVVMLASLNKRLRSETRNDDRISDRIEHERNVALMIIGSCVLSWSLMLLLLFLVLLVRFSVGNALFLSVSCVNNVGLTLSRSDFFEYRHDRLLITIFSLAMPLGNTLFPIVLRILLLSMRHIFHMLVVSKDARSNWVAWHLAVDDLLRKPRLLCCHLFDHSDSIRLVCLWWVVTAVGFAMFIPDYNTAVFSSTDLSSQMLTAFFQTVAVRTSGFAIFDLTLLRAGHLAVWMIGMYITAYPIILMGSARRNRVQGSAIEPGGASVAGRDLVWVYLSVVVILFAQDHHVGTTQLDPSFFLRTCFECVSAFGNVGLSLSRTSGVVSFSSELNAVSRVAIATLMLAGKMRSLPSKFMVNVSDKEATSEDEELGELLGSPSTSSPTFPVAPQPQL